LANIDLEKRVIKDEFKSLDIIRIGTSGSIQKDIPINSFVISEYAVGFDGLLHFYDSENFQIKEIADAVEKQTQWPKDKAKPYVFKSDDILYNKVFSDKTFRGFTATNVGFYGPQGRILRLALNDNKMNRNLTDFRFKGLSITNMEMETAAIYGLSKLMGHNALSLNAIIANRETGEFTSKPNALVNNLIEYTLNKLTS